jgi:hypothetical protein
MDDDDRDILDYLLGHDPLAKRLQLARQGPPVIDPLLRLSIPALQSIGHRLAAVISKTAEQQKVHNSVAAAEAMAREQFREEMEEGTKVDDMFIRTQVLISDIAGKQGATVAKRIENALLGADDYVAIVAAVHAATNGIPAEHITGGLIRLYTKNTDPLLQYAVSASLCRFARHIHTSVSSNAMENVSNFANECRSMLPALVYRVENKYLAERNPLEQALLLTKLGVFYMILVQD